MPHMPDDQEMKATRLRLGQFLDAALVPSDASKPDLYAVLLAGHVGGWRPGEAIMEAYARSLGYSGLGALRGARKDEVKERRYLALDGLFQDHGMDTDDAVPRKDLVGIIVDLLAGLPDRLKEAAEAMGVGAPPAADA